MVRFSKKRPLRFATAKVGFGVLLVVLSTEAGADQTLYKQGDTEIDLSFMAGAAAFAGRDSIFGASDTFLGADTDHWTEYAGELGLSFQRTFGVGTVFGAATGLYSATTGDDASGLTIGLDDTAESSLGQLYLGWRVENVFAGLSNDTLSLSVGQQDYVIGTGLIIGSGSDNGGELGGWVTGPRSEFANSGILSLKSDELLLELIQLENDPRLGGPSGELRGVNLEFALPALHVGAGGDSNRVGVTYLRLDSDVPEFQPIDVYSLRGDISPWANLTLSGEYVLENNRMIHADAFFVQGTYAFADAPWTPSVTARYARFDGDDPDTETNEMFFEIAYGATDYGYWIQGDITGNYLLGNGNVESSMVRATLAPTASVTVNLIWLGFTLVVPEELDPAVTSDDFGDEFNLAVDWQVTDQVLVSAVLGAMVPGAAAKQWTGGRDTWLYSMVAATFTL